MNIHDRVLMKHFEVPIIAVFTKYDQFLYNVEMDMLDDPDEFQDCIVSEIATKRFQEHYLCPLGNKVEYVRLESELLAILQDHMLTVFGRNG
jgi:hypothetical protein